MNQDLELLRNQPIDGYSHPVETNKAKRGKVYSKYRSTSNNPYKRTGVVENKYNNEVYEEKDCFKCDKKLSNCTCNIQSTLQ